MTEQTEKPFADSLIVRIVADITQAAAVFDDLLAKVEQLKTAVEGLNQSLALASNTKGDRP